LTPVIQKKIFSKVKRLLYLVPRIRLSMKAATLKEKKKRLKENMFERVMRATNVLLNASVSPVVKNRCVR
jgi:hypothetical protein